MSKKEVEEWIKLTKAEIEIEKGVVVQEEELKWKIFVPEKIELYDSPKWLRRHFDITITDIDYKDILPPQPISIQEIGTVPPMEYCYVVETFFDTYLVCNPLGSRNDIANDLTTKLTEVQDRITKRHSRINSLKKEVKILREEIPKPKYLKEEQHEKIEQLREEISIYYYEIGKWNRIQRLIEEANKTIR